MLIDNFNLKERMAIELKYLGNTNAEIAEKCDTPQGTVEDWFKSEGKLYLAYQEYKEYMNAKRQKNIEDQIYLADDAIATITTNIMISVGKRMQKRMVPMKNKDGSVLAGPDGKPVMVEVDPDDSFSVSDFVQAWKIQRLQRGLPVDYQKQDIQQTNFEADMIIKELGLTDEDFKDENIDATTKLIADHLAKVS